MKARINDIHGNNVVVDQAELDDPKDFSVIVYDEIAAAAKQVSDQIEDDESEPFVGTTTFSITVEVTQ